MAWPCVTSSICWRPWKFLSDREELFSFRLVSQSGLSGQPISACHSFTKGSRYVICCSADSFSFNFVILKSSSASLIRELNIWKLAFPCFFLQKYTFFTRYVQCIFKNIYRTTSLSFQTKQKTEWECPTEPKNNRLVHETNQRWITDIHICDCVLWVLES